MFYHIIQVMVDSISHLPGSEDLYVWDKEIKTRVLSDQVTGVDDSLTLKYLLTSHRNL